MFEELKTKLRNEIINNERVPAIYSDNAEKLVAYASNTTDIKEEIACLEIIFDDIDDVLFAGNWRMWLLGAYYDGGYINSPEAINLSLLFLEKGVETIMDDQYVPKVYSFIYCSLLSSNNPDNIKIAKELKSKVSLVESIIAKYEPKGSEKSSGCYVATCIYGSYDCPPVWTLRRFRDDILSQNILGKLFIKFYYATSPTAVKIFGNQVWFHNLFKAHLDKLVKKLQENGISDTPYND